MWFRISALAKTSTVSNHGRVTWAFLPRLAANDCGNRIAFVFGLMHAEGLISSVW